MSNRLKNEASPYLLQHAENPVDWYPWGSEAFERAEREDKPVFLSIGYSTCHWCHVMARESFEDPEIAEILNRHFIAVKVDREERPDVDSVYMAVCQEFTGSGGWPTSIFMTPDQRPFFAGTYFPKTSGRGSVGFRELLLAVHGKWENDREALLRSADEAVRAINSVPPPPAREGDPLGQAGAELPQLAIEQYKRSFDRRWGGFGGAPKFPAAHGLLFLMRQYRKRGDRELLEMAEKTLRQMYRGGIFDHIGGGFCRYSTDRFYLVPHFEKMLCDNALLISALCEAFELTGKELYKLAAEKTAGYVLREMTSPQGGFFSAQDADSDGQEGKYYVFTPGEIKAVLGESRGEAFCKYYDVTDPGNFEGKSIPNLLRTEKPDGRFDPLLPALREYRLGRAELRRDDKILTFWNCLMISALCALYRVSGNAAYLSSAQAAQTFIEENLCRGDALFVSRREDRLGGRGFLDDYAGYACALLALYDATLRQEYLSRAERITARAIELFFDAENGGFYLYGGENEALISRPKECYDGALPSGNSLMASCMVRLSLLSPDEARDGPLKKHLRFMAGQAERYPAGHAMFLASLSDYLEPPMTVTVVGGSELLSSLPLRLPLDAAVRATETPEGGFELINGEAAFYVCKNHSCLPPMGESEFFAGLPPVRR